ncbi:MAG TPA: tRNA (adenosine(37)-N6)-threonylcarbamoyltransferase complex dimerization subunit type 1 TsaB, partial [Flavobacteriales bacterium]|nr:tRNA (adenosine(37)-N6)-threonylcarbamoyltransferase complex dimerization subunit type 1 TsaB [Flavobacteriales bacterium]
LISERSIENERNAHAEKVNLFIEEVMQEAGLPMMSIDAVAVGLGPGSYTGSRIGLSVAKGLCYALEKPILGVSTLITLLESARSGGASLTGACWPMIDARRMEVFTQGFTAEGSPMLEERPLVLDEQWAKDAGHAFVFGDGADKATSIWQLAPNIKHIPAVKPYARHMLAVAERRIAAKRFDDLAYLVPSYGKGANLTKSRPR